MDLSFYKGKTVLVTGDTGFKGSWLSLWLLSLGARVFGYALPPKKGEHFDACGLAKKIEHVDGDIRDARRLKKIISTTKPEIAFHLAAQPLVLQSYKDPIETFETNVMGTANFLEAIRACKSMRAAVVITTDKVYENPERGKAFKESDPLGGHDPYSASKAAVEIVTQSYSRSFFAENTGPAVASARAGNVIGGGDFAQYRIVPDCIRALQAGKPIVVRNPHSIRPWQHVLEPLYGYLLLGASLSVKGQDFSGPWNFGSLSAQSRTVEELVNELIAAWGAGAVKYCDPEKPRPKEAEYLHLNSSKATRFLGWKRIFTFREAVKNTVDEYRIMEHAGPEELFRDRIGRIKSFENKINAKK
ncbi:MAG: CDP-glucose 4,6-dehydratase [Chitinivibrionales bacterium]